MFILKNCLQVLYMYLDNLKLVYLAYYTLIWKFLLAKMCMFTAFQIVLDVSISLSEKSSFGLTFSSCPFIMQELEMSFRSRTSWGNAQYPQSVCMLMLELLNLSNVGLLLLSS